MRTFDFAVKVRASGLVGAGFYAVPHKPSLNLSAKNSIPRSVWHRKRRLFEYPVQKIKRVAGVAVFVDLEHPVFDADVSALPGKGLLVLLFV